jgi:hypothetical protein
MHGLTPFLWAGDLDAGGKRLVGWDQRVSELRAKGYQVYERRSEKGQHLALQENLQTLSKDRTLQGLLFQGHGSRRLLGSGGKIPVGSPNVVELVFINDLV